MIRAMLIAVGGSALLALAILVWPAGEGDPSGPAASASPSSIAASGAEEPSTAARQIEFSPPGQTLTVETQGEGAAQPPPAVDALPILVGVVGSSDRPVGYFSSNGQVFRAARGDEVDGWRVTALGRRGARLERRGRRLNLSLFAARSGALSPPMAALPPPAAAAVSPPSTPAATSASTPSTGPATTPGRKAPRVRRPLPPLPPGSKGYWIGPPGSMPPGFTPMPTGD